MGACASALTSYSSSRDAIEEDEILSLHQQASVSNQNPDAERVQASAKRFLEYTASLPSMIGKVVVVAGVSGGSMLVATTLAEMGAYVIIVTSMRLSTAKYNTLRDTMDEAVQTFDATSRARTALASNATWPNGSSGPPALGLGSASVSYTSNQSSHTKGIQSGSNTCTNGAAGLRVVGVSASQDTATSTKSRPSIAATTAAAQSAHQASYQGRSCSAPQSRPGPVSEAMQQGYTIFQSDFQKLRSIQDCSHKILKLLENDLGCGLDILINMEESRIKTRRSRRYTLDGFDSQIQANMLAQYLLTQLLLPAITSAGASGSCGVPRIVNCTSGSLKTINTPLTPEPFNQVLASQSANPVSIRNDASAQLSQSRKGRIVFTLALQAVMQRAGVNAIATTALLGSYESLMNTERKDLPGSGNNGSSGQPSSLEGWLPVLCCACQESVQGGSCYVSGPYTHGSGEIGVGGPRCDDPVAVDLSTLGNPIEDDVIQLLWRSCHLAVARYLPHVG